ncbi:four helix bundle protein [Candidatus Roizmanbacteria bacterium CG_4_8_14_3_um_filter_34_9]|uniref:Four helix bundle protein n=2 Tax=Candidatus Roizmaniibacteriota TaxID=1752723 RepID=A0A2M6YUD4_9BACT|nr:MAG: four helix bundle protein [Candidatus Roizmanbacteria bacterium CG07_land_8_20_14_0_80_34_15]PIW73067.1 MAG: four helix bundle protein [Candidatus Roizmanbacteria bacterium CG_4_8_14_3_um_filter_34_9]
MAGVEDLRIHKKALELVKQIYLLIKDNPKLSRDFSLCDQIKRASVSVVTNIAEGYFRSKKQSQNYLEISSGSSNEVVSLLRIIYLVYEINTSELIQEYIILGKQINAFSKTFNY